MGLPFHPSAKAHVGETRAQTQTAIHFRKDKMGDLPSICNRFGLD